MQFKKYQELALAALETFLADAQEIGPEAAFNAVTGTPDMQRRLGRYARPYSPPKGLADTPYCCVRLPTGGGKTLLAAHTVKLARDAGVSRDYPLVLWLVTSNAIRAQTADALNDPRHAYRQALDETFGGRVRVFDIADFAQIRPHDLQQYACIVIGTVQALKVENTEGRKVYAHHEELEPHFSPLTSADLARFPGLERRPNGGVNFSFANLLHLNRPLMIVDEAHNVVTGLSDQMRERINPWAVVEFTATPKGRSNILFNATASELKAEQMIKLPIVLLEHSQWGAAVAAAVVERNDLAKIALEDANYVRPIVLYQAEPKDREVTIDVLRRHLIDDLGVAENKIAVATGERRELDGVNLAARDCPIEHIITVEALKEGWDCPFAYVFCSVASIKSSTAVEQLLGRVLRMPYATRRKANALNKAYAHVSEPTFYAAATTLRDALVDMGFDDSEAEGAIEHSYLPLMDGFELAAPENSFAFDVPDTAEMRALFEAMGVAAPAPVNGSIAVPRHLLSREGVVDKLKAAAPALASALTAHLLQLAPAARGEVLRVPALGTRVQGELVFADADLLMEHVDWRLSETPGDVPGLAESLKQTVRRFEIDVNGQSLTQAFLSSGDEQLIGETPPENWTSDRLVTLLDPLTRQADLSQPDLIGWLNKVVQVLIGQGRSVQELMRMKHAMARRLNNRITELRREQRGKVVQRFLFDPGAKLEPLANQAFIFRQGMYDDQTPYRGPFQFKKHFLERVPAFDGKSDGEEARCAMVLDGLDAVESWVRNVARHPASFWLQTSTDRAYPDFVARLTDGRIFVVEYKGADRWNEAAEDRAIGAVWARTTGNLYLMVRNKDDAGRGPHEQLLKHLEVN
jgi:type III restriction enzyme